MIRSPFVAAVTLCVGILTLPEAGAGQGVPVASQGPLLFHADLDSAATRVIAIDVTYPLRKMQDRERWSPDVVGAVGRLMSAATAWAIASHSRDMVTISVEGNGFASPVQVAFDPRALMYTAEVGSERNGSVRMDSIVPSRALGSKGTMVVTYNRGQTVTMPLETGEIGNEIASLLSDYLDIGAAASVGEYLLPSQLAGSGAVIFLLDADATDEQANRALAAVNRLGRISLMIRDGDGPTDWLRKVTTGPIRQLRF